jgi:Fe-S cluster biogenesis protein NfuA
MSQSDEEIVSQVKQLLEERVQPAVASHGGSVNFVSYDQGTLRLQLSGACSGCAGSTTTIKFGVENMMKHYIPEIENVVAEDDPNSTVDPYFT